MLADCIQTTDTGRVYTDYRYWQSVYRLQILADHIYPESQCGFRSTVDMIFSAGQLQEKCREQQQPLYLAFIDLTKAFDLVSRTGLFKPLEKIECPPKLLTIVAPFHVNKHATVSFDGEISELFKIDSGVKQNCVLAPTRFGIFFFLMLTYASGSVSDGIYLHTRPDMMANCSTRNCYEQIPKSFVSS